MRLVFFSVLTFLATIFVGCAGDRGSNYRYLYTMTNDPSNNEIYVYRHIETIPPELIGTYTTGGAGFVVLVDGQPIADPLGSQDALIVDTGRQLLFAVNAGSNSISTFSIQDDFLERISVVDSGGVRPVSLTISNNMLFVVNQGGGGNIVGFNIGSDGQLSRRTDTIKPLSGASNPGAGVITSSQDGSLLAVTEKLSNKISLYRIDNAGVPAGPMVRDSLGNTPFGAEFLGNDQLFVSEANVLNPGPPPVPAPNGSSTSSYIVNSNNNLVPVSSSVPTTETAACWIEFSSDGRYVYTTNTGSSTITGYRVSGNGALERLSADGRTGVVPLAGAAPLDMATTSNTLYVLSGGIGAISIFDIGSDGSLTSRPDLGVVGLPPYVTGLAAYPGDSGAADE